MAIKKSAASTVVILMERYIKSILLSSSCLFLSINHNCVLMSLSLILSQIIGLV